MKKFNHSKIESVIGYKFNNKNLLKQAFTRSSYAYENGCESNEVLEFIGDKVLDLAVIRIMLAKYKSNNDDGFFKSSKQEGELTRIKSELVNSSYLADAFDSLNLEEYILFGKSDLKNNAAFAVSIKEDVLESIFGAIALDSNWNMNKIIKIIKKILNVKEFLEQAEVDSNVVGQLQEYALLLNLDLPIYDFDLVKKAGAIVWRATVRIRGISETFIGVGSKQKDAKKEAAFQMLHFLRYQQTKQEHAKIEKAHQEDVFAAINSLVQTGEIEKPTYEFDTEYDDDGNPVWKCSTDIPELGYVYYGYGSTKKEAKMNSLLEAFKDIKIGG